MDEYKKEGHFVLVIESTKGPYVDLRVPKFGESNGGHEDVPTVNDDHGQTN